MTYTLTRPITVYSKTRQSLAELPAGAVVTLVQAPARPESFGLVEILWDGHAFFAYNQDLECADELPQQSD